MARLLRVLVRSAILAKAVQIVRREMAKPENRRRAAALWRKVTSRESSSAPVVRRTTVRSGVRRSPAHG